MLGEVARAADPAVTARSWLRAKSSEFFEIDLRSLALFRIALGALILADLALRWPFIAASLSDAGSWPRSAVRSTGPLFSFYMWSGAAGFQTLLFCVAGVCALMLLVGCYTRFASVASWLLLGSLQLRHSELLNGGDSLLRMLLCWSVFLPLGARASVDAARRPERAAAGPAILSVASVALTLQFAILYIDAGLLKTGAAWVSDGTAIETALSIRVRRGVAAPLLLQYPDLLRALTPIALYFERLGPLGIFFPCFTAPIRSFTLLAFWGFQLGLGLGISLQLFPFVCTAATLPLFPGWLWDRLAARGWPQLASAAPARPERGAAAGGIARAARRLLAGAASGLAALFLAASLALMLQSLSIVRVPRELRSWSALFGVEQSWGMFSPSPPNFDAVFEIYGDLPDGNALSLLDVEAGERWSRVLRFHRSFRMRIALDAVATRRGPLPSHYLRWLCRKWNQPQPPALRVERLRMLITWVPLNPGPEPPRRYEVAEVACGGPR